jgi:hypothetical protein
MTPTSFSSKGPAARGKDKARGFFGIEAKPEITNPHWTERDMDHDG